MLLQENVFDVAVAVCCGGAKATAISTAIIITNVCQCQCHCCCHGHRNSLVDCCFFFNLTLFFVVAVAVLLRLFQCHCKDLTKKQSKLSRWLPAWKLLEQGGRTARSKWMLHGLLFKQPSPLIQPVLPLLEREEGKASKYCKWWGRTVTSNKWCNNLPIKTLNTLNTARRLKIKQSPVSHHCQSSLRQKK